MSNKFEEKVAAFNKAFESLAYAKEPSFNAIVITKSGEESSTYSAFGDDELETVGMLFNAFITKTKDLADPQQIPDMVLTLIMVLDMEITDDFLQALQNMALKVKSNTIH